MSNGLESLSNGKPKLTNKLPGSLIEIVLFKADGTLRDEHIPDTIIRICQPLGRIQYGSSEWTLKDIENFYRKQAEVLVDALFNALPQGTFDRMTIEIMKKKVSLYRGKTES